MSLLFNTSYFMPDMPSMQQYWPNLTTWRQQKCSSQLHQYSAPFLTLSSAWVAICSATDRNSEIQQITISFLRPTTSLA